MQGDQGDDGLLQRFQLLVWPDFPKIWRNVDRWPDKDAKNRAYKVFEKLDDLQAEGFGLTCEEAGEIPAARFTSDAQNEFDSWRSDLETQKREAERPARGPSRQVPLPYALSRTRLPAYRVCGRHGREGGAVGLRSALQAAA
jgi:hypothetical protein